jgi:hypothetical protein
MRWQSLFALSTLLALAACSGSPSGSDATGRSDETEDPDANQLVLYAIPAPSSLLNSEGLSWRSPGRLVRDVLVNEAGGALLDFKNTIGHAGVRVQCAAGAGRPAEHFQGSMTNVNNTDFNDLLLKKEIGLGMFFDNVPGRLQTEDELQQSIDTREKDGSIAFVRFQISAATCHGLVAYAAAYSAANVQRNYGLAARPLYKEGAGCSAFSMAFLELANLIEPRFHDAWSFSVRVPLSERSVLGWGQEVLIGGTRHPENKVPFTRLVTLGRNWAAPNEDGIDLFGWDPTQMYNWLQQTTAAAETSGAERVEVHGQARGLVLDRREVAPSPALANGTFFQAE